MILELHAHSKYSFDSMAKPRKILEAAIKAGLDGIAITDHNTIRGAVETATINQNPKFQVIIGTEIASDAGDIVGLFLSDEIRARKYMEVIDEIHRQNGIAVLPHPYKGHRLIDEMIRNIDLIEGINARTSMEDNNKAIELARRFDKPIIAGSDAHFLWEIGRCRVAIESNDIRQALLEGKISLQTALTPRYFLNASQIIKSVKKHKYHKIPFQVAKLAKNYIFE